MGSRNTYIAAVLLLIISWMPNAGFLQLIGYVGPFLVVVQAVLTGTARIERFDARMLLAIFGFVTVVALLHVNTTGPIHPMLGLLTHLSIVLLAVRFRDVDDQLIADFAAAVAWVSIFEVVLGMGQLLRAVGPSLDFDEGAGDAMKGTTMSAFSHMLALKEMFQGLFLIYMWQQARNCPGVRVKKNLLLIGGLTAIFGAIFASFTSGFALFLATIIGWRLLALLKPLVARWTGTVRERKRALRNALLVFGGLFAGGVGAASIILVTQPVIVRGALMYAQMITEEDVSDHPMFQKIVTFRASIVEVLLADPVNAVFGLGLGRYSSRAAMILTGRYLGNHPSVIPISMSPETFTQIYPRWTREMQEVTLGSIMTMPTSSVQSILVEFGLLGTLMLTGYFRSLWKRSGKYEQQMPEGSFRRALATLVPVLIGLLAVECLTDLWFEFSACNSFIYLLIALTMSARLDAEHRNQTAIPQREGIAV